MGLYPTHEVMDADCNMFRNSKKEEAESLTVGGKYMERAQKQLTSITGGEP